MGCAYGEAGTASWAAPSLATLPLGCLSVRFAAPLRYAAGRVAAIADVFLPRSPSGGFSASFIERRKAFSCNRRAIRQLCIPDYLSDSGDARAYDLQGRQTKEWTVPD